MNINWIPLLFPCFAFQSVENCVCILHNLTYQLEAENPACFEKYQPRTEAQVENKKQSPVGCFSPKSNKAQKQVGISRGGGTVRVHQNLL